MPISEERMVAHIKEHQDAFDQVAVRNKRRRDY